MKHQWRSDCFLAGFRLFDIFHIIPHMFGVYGRIFKIFSVKDKLNFPSIEENNNDGQSASLQLFGYFYIIHIFPHIFGVFGPSIKIFSVINIKIKFPGVSRKETTAVRLPFSRYLAIFICFTYFPISLVFIVRYSNFVMTVSIFFSIVMSI